MRIVLTALLLIGSSMSSIAQTSQFRFEETSHCTPESVDGTQVTLSAFLDGECTGKPKTVLYIADYTLKALCSMPALECVRDDEMTDEQTLLYQDLEKYRVNKLSFPKMGVRSDGSFWRFEMITGGDATFSTPHNGARSYDLVFKKGCVHYGSTKVGCVTLYPEHVSQLATQ